MTLPQLPISAAKTDNLSNFIISQEGINWLNEIIKYDGFEAYTRDYYTKISRQTCNEIAQAVINEHYGNQDNDAWDKIYANDPWYHWTGELRDSIDELLEPLNKQHWIDDLFHYWLDAATTADTSKPIDCLGSYDDCEIIFGFTPMRNFEDSCINANGRTSEFGNLIIEQNLQFGLAQLGYTISEYRFASSSR
jgi:hypothetical protein